jgi:cobalt-zinc-cadmium efflux system membrane fusion protein
VRSSALPELGRELKSSLAALAVKRASVERVRDLVRLGVVPEKELLFAEQELKDASLAREAAEGKRQSLRVGALDPRGLYWIRATKPGTVFERRALVGMEVGPDRPDPLVSIAELDEVIVIADVVEADVEGLRAGQVAHIVTSGGRSGPPIEGLVEHVSEFVDATRRTVAVRVRVNNGGRLLRPNAFVQVTFEPAGAPRIVVPSDAVVVDDQKSVIFVEASRPGEAKRLQRREVQVGRSRDGWTEVLEGLAEGETYVSRGALLLLNALDLGG